GVLLRRRDDDRDDVQPGEAHERPDVGGAGQAAGGAFDPLDHADRDARDVGPLALRSERDDPLADVDGGGGVQELEAQRRLALAAEAAAAAALHDPDLLGAFQPGADRGGLVGGEQDGRGRGPDAGDAADQPLGAQHGHVALDAAAAARVDRDGVLEALPGGDHLRGKDLVAAHPGGAEEPLELRGLVL